MSKHWPRVRLGDVLIEQKQRIGTFDADNLPLLGVSNQAGLHRSGMPRISDMSRYLRVEKDWFAYNPMRINVGSVGWAETVDQIGIISPDYVVFSCSDRILPRLLFSYLKHRQGLQAINDATAGSVRERLYFDALAQIEFSLPPLAEQRRIVARIEEMAAQINEARTSRKQSAAEALALTQAVLYRLARDLNPTGRLGDVLSMPPRNGWSARCDNADDGTPVLSLGAVTGFQYRATEFKRTSLYAERGGHFWLKPGDLLISRSNTPELVGHAAFYDGNPTPCIYPDLMMRLEFKYLSVERRFIWYWLQSPWVREFIKNNAKGTSPTMKKISQSTVMAIPFPTSLSLSEQREIVSELDKLQSEVTALKRLQAETASELDALLPSILNRAFRGEL
jgi:type I restriction enzyme S subunit